PRAGAPGGGGAGRSPPHRGGAEDAGRDRAARSGGPAGAAGAGRRRISLIAVPRDRWSEARAPRRLSRFMPSFPEIRAQRLRDEVGTLHRQGDLAFALVYPSPYHVGMSSLGFQTIYRELNALPGVAAERAFLPDDLGEARRQREGLCTYESGRPVG